MLSPAPLTIVGAGPAGLAAAITAAARGCRVRVHERRDTVGGRFHGDFQGLENWSSTDDVRDVLSRMGIAPDFPCTPFHRLRAFDAWGQAYDFESARPLFYLVRRGSDDDTLDRALLQQALRLGVEVRFGERCTRLTEGGICAEGPKAGDVIATGYQFATYLDDGAYAALSDRLAPAGYAYLLIHRRQATLASCMFDDFHREHEYLQRTVAFFERHVGFSMPGDAQRFGGLGNVQYPLRARNGRILYAGEVAGFQDALWGFGMRLAMCSGHLAAQAWCSGNLQAYDEAWPRVIGPCMRAGLFNRWLYARLGDGGYRRMLQRMAAAADIREWLCRLYRQHWYTRMLFPWIRRRQHSRRKQQRCSVDGCSCTWCRCRHPRR